MSERRKRNSSRVNLTISFIFHSVLITAIFYFAAREGMLGKKMKTIVAEMVKEKKPVEPPKQREEPNVQQARQTEQPKTVAATPPPQARTVAPAPAVEAPPVAAPPAVDVPGLLEQVIALRTSDPDLNVVIRGSAKAKYKNVVAVMDMLQQANVGKVNLATEPATEGAARKE